jgi:hypothetical protein
MRQRWLRKGGRGCRPNAGNQGQEGINEDRGRVRRAHRRRDRLAEVVTALLPGTTELAKTYQGVFYLAYLLLVMVLMGWSRRGAPGAHSERSGTGPL